MSSSEPSSSEDEDDTLTTPKHILKPPKFDGQSSFQTFMAQFSNCAEHNKWNRAQKLAYLRNSLEKEAANILWDYGKDVTDSLSGLMNILKTRFGGKVVADKHRIELRNRRCRQNESLQSLHSDIQRLAALAFPNVQPQMQEEIACDHFLDGLGDPDFVLKIRERRPADLDSALQIALQLEVWTTDTARLREAAKLERGEVKRVREISNKKPDPMDALQKEVEKMEKKLVEFEHRMPKTPNNGGFSNNYRQPNSNRHTAPNFYGGAPPESGRFTSLSSRGPNPANYGNSNNFVRPRGFNGSNRNSNYGPPNPNSGCYRGGDQMHRARECPVSSAEQRRPEQQPTSSPQQPDVRPMKDHSNKQDRTCIWVKYRQNRISALIDTGSDVSIAGEDIARNMGWTIHAHLPKEVSVANNETVSILGAARVVLFVAGRGVESEILIAPDLDGLILGIDWLRSQARIRWDCDNRRTQFGDREWIELRREAEQPCRTSVYKVGQTRSPNKCLGTLSRSKLNTIHLLSEKAVRQRG